MAFPTGIGIESLAPDMALKRLTVRNAKGVDAIAIVEVEAM